MPKSPILGTAYTAKSKDLAFQRCINLYLESMETQSGTAPAVLLACPGLLLSMTLGSGPVRCLSAIGDGFYAISGDTAYQINNALVATPLGTIGTTTGAAYILHNATQVAFFDGTGCWVWSGTSFASVTLPYTGPVGVPVYQDTYGLLSQPGTFNIWQSNINDFTTWDSLNFTTEDGNAEPIVALATIHDQVVVLKQYSTCFYANAGLNGFAFQRLPGIYPGIGCVSAQSVAVLDDTLIFLGSTWNGAAKVYMMRGYEPVEVSTYAIEHTIGEYTTTSDAIGWSYSQEGHPFYVISFPSGGETWVVDLKETGKMKVGVWHQRASFANGQFGLYAGNCAVRFNETVLMGDYSNGNIYRLTLEENTDAGATRKWLRSWLAAGPAKYGTQKINWLDIQMATGSDVDPNTNPQMIFRQSYDNGANWSAERFIPAGKSGQNALGVHITRLGAGGRSMNQTRAFELSSTDDFRVELLGAEYG
jgi:hypothetical protein